MVFDTRTIKRKHSKENLMDNIFKRNFIDNNSRIERKRSKENIIDSTFKGK